jgi:hypothetical protein
VMGQYIPQLVQKLSGKGVAFVHHSNFFDLPPGTANPHSRATSVSAQKVFDLVAGCGGIVLVQEVVNWGGYDLIDCFTAFGKAEAFPGWEPVRTTNTRWVDEMNIIREMQSPYSRLPGGWGEPPTLPKDRGLLHQGVKVIKGWIGRHGG